MENNFFFNNDDEVKESVEVENISSGSDEDYLFEGIKKASMEEENENVNSIHNYLCQDCNTHFLTSNGEKVCIYCGSNNIIDGANEEIVNVYYLPFNKSVDEALNEYKKNIRFNIFIPFMLRKKSFYNNIRKVYLPGIIRNSNISGQIVFYAADNSKNGKQVESKKYESGYTVNFDFNNIFASRYSKINEEEYDNINNYDLNMMSLFDNTSINDSNCILSDTDDSLINDKINNKITKYAISNVRDSITHDLRKLKQNNTVIKTISEQNILYPVYLIHAKNGEKEYTYIMNAQNGKTFLKYDISILSVAVFSIVLFALIFGIVFLIAWFL